MGGSLSNVLSSQRDLEIFSSFCLGHGETLGCIKIAALAFPHPLQLVWIVVFLATMLLGVDIGLGVGVGFSLLVIIIRTIL